MARYYSFGVFGWKDKIEFDCSYSLVPRFEHFHSTTLWTLPHSTTLWTLPHSTTLWTLPHSTTPQTLPQYHALNTSTQYHASKHFHSTPGQVLPDKGIPLPGGIPPQVPPVRPSWGTPPRVPSVFRMKSTVDQEGNPTCHGVPHPCTLITRCPLLSQCALSWPGQGYSIMGHPHPDLARVPHLTWPEVPCDGIPPILTWPEGISISRYHILNWLGVPHLLWSWSTPILTWHGGGNYPSPGCGVPHPDLARVVPCKMEATQILVIRAIAPLMRGEKCCWI